jgi:hypothetical protein
MTREFKTTMKEHQERNYLSLGLGPPLLLILLLVGGLIREYRAATIVDSRSAKLRSELASAVHETSAIETDQADEPTHGDANDRDEWLRLALATREIINQVNFWGRDLPGPSKQFLLAPGSEWEHAAVVEAILTDAAPIIERMIELIGSQSWDKIESRDEIEFPMLELLKHRLRLTIYLSDHDRALETLEALHQFDNRLAQASANVYQLIVESIGIGFWQTTEHTQRIRRLIADPVDSPPVLEDIQRQRSESVLASIAWQRHGLPDNVTGRHNFPFRVPPTAQLHWLDELASFAAVADAGSIRHFRELTHPEDSVGGLDLMTITGAPFADVRAYEIGGYPYWSVWGLPSLEFSRYLALTLVAIKQYQLKYGQWPASESQLAEYAVPPLDPTRPQASPFAIEFTDEGVTVRAPDGIQEWLAHQQMAENDARRNLLNELHVR